MGIFLIGLFVVSAITFLAGHLLQLLDRPRFYSFIFAPVIFLIGYAGSLIALDCGGGACDFGWWPFFRVNLLYALPMLLLGSLVSALALGHLRK